MEATQKLVLLKTAWCDWYDGDEVSGNFGYVEENGPNSGHERFNFRRSTDNLYRGYIPPIGGNHSLPNPTDPHNWTVVWVSKKPGTKGVRVVGVYFDASFVPSGNTYEVAGETISYCVFAHNGFVVPPEIRVESFKSPVKAGPCCYLRGGNNDAKYRKLTNYLYKEIIRLRNESQVEIDSTANKAGFPTTEHIRKVEKAAIDFVQRYFEKRHYTITDRQKDNKGYDLEATSSREKLLLEVKGTAGSTPYAYITANELAKAKASSTNWRMCMVTQALTKPKLTIMSTKDFLDRFNLEPICYRAILKDSN